MVITFDRNPHLTEDQKLDSLARSVQLALNEKADKDTASQTFVDKDTAAQYVIKSALLDMVYPVGSYYETSDTAYDPNATWGGAWTSETITDDVIIEEGTSGIWTYRKWASGTAECWGGLTWTITSWTAWGSSYYSTASPVTDFPSGLFIRAPLMTTSGRTSNGDVITYWRSATTFSKDTAPTFGFIRPADGTDNITGYLYMHAIGTWKTYTTPTTIYRWHRTA